MPGVIRWSRTAYETDEALAAEKADAEALGMDWRLEVGRSRPPADLAGAEVLVVTSKVRVDASVLRALGGGLVLTTTSGVDHIDVAAAEAQGIAVARCPLARRDPVVEHALHGLIGGMRRLADLDRAALAGRWARADLPRLAGRGLAGSRVGVVGLGVIGTQMARVLDVLGAAVVGVDPFAADPGRPVHDLDEVLPTLDAITLHCQLTPSSRGLLSADRLARLPRHAVVVNTSRGEVLDVRAAVDAVRDGRLRALACDVFPEEPWPHLAQMAAVEGVSLTPHASGHVHDLGARVAREVAESLRAWVSGRPLPARIV